MKSRFTVEEVIKSSGRKDVQAYTDLFDHEGKFNLRNKNGNEQLAKENAANVRTSRSKVIESIEVAIKKSGLKDGGTISFHHHFRNGDKTVELVMDTVASMGFKDLRVAASSFTQAHTCMIEHIKNGVVSELETSGCRGKLAEEISKGLLKKPMIIRSHGGRAAAIESGRLKIDVAFLAVSSTDEFGNANGVSGKTQCGSLGYAMMDAQHAGTVILLTDTLVNYPNYPISIPQTHVDFIVEVNEIGDAKGIMSGATRFTKNPKELLIAKQVSKVISSTSYFRNGFSMQTGTGGAALAVSRFLKDVMDKEDIKGSFILGGITKSNVQLLEEGYFKRILDTQCFDLAAVESMGTNQNHVEISAGMYASSYNKGAAVNKLDYVILSALEVDVDFNVNVITGSDGIIRGASGGHSDTATAANCSIIVCPLIRGRLPSIVDQVQTVITPGNAIDMVVTDVGIAVNPNRKDLLEELEKANIKTFTIEELRDKAYAITGKPDAIVYEEDIVALVEYRDGTILDVIRKIK